MVVSEGFKCGWKSSPMWCAGVMGWLYQHAMELEGVRLQQVHGCRHQSVKARGDHRDYPGAGSKRD